MRWLALVALVACGGGSASPPPVDNTGVAPVENTGGSGFVLSPPGEQVEIEARCSDWTPGSPTAVGREPADWWTTTLATCHWAAACRDACCPVSCESREHPIPTEACDEGGVLNRLVLLDEDSCRG